MQKWDDKINPKAEDYPIFMAVSENSGKDNSGKEIYQTNDNGERSLDKHNHLIQQHDLQEIAIEFEKWAIKQKLSFWK
ncbi:DNA METHYLASE-TYPE I RESTRICTION-MODIFICATIONSYSTEM [Bathymodiolus azoricus thioautotrophic gill symbiont]|uniref:DNA METHYLASE-TYPE I RESTRICTION-MODIFICATIONSYSTEM n=1 Tax=Bathymodiolus azoricus thioautotrophic gill symbiont TaxID=235205 RepID=A0A1H6JAZ4_9GAMM|nr:DNA METHYLASE-TYPE I RESTRICTION-MODIFICATIONSYSTEM [Bathymodiolus azoricus thioautotrophic gill symbiont]